MKTKMAPASKAATTSGSEEETKQVLDERKQRRMLSNRESARRSRMRKQQHLDELRAEATHLRGENNAILTKVNTLCHNYMQIEEENKKLRSYADHLNAKLQSLNMILQLLNGMDVASTCSGVGLFEEPNPSLLNPLDLKYSYFPPLTPTEI